MYYVIYTYVVPADRHLSSDLQKHFHEHVLPLWPVLKGCVSEVRKPCIRRNCPACAQGDKHPAFIFSFTEKGRRRCMYVPAELVPLLRQGLENGRKLEALLCEIGPQLLRYYREERALKLKT